LNKESRIQLAVSDYKKGNLTSVKEAARVHGVAYETVRDLNGLQAKCHTIPRTRKLSVDQENALVKYILNLNSRGFPPKPRYVREMGNALLAQDGDGNWVSSFVKRREELRSMFTRKYDYRRALSEDPDIIKEWFDRPSLPSSPERMWASKTPRNNQRIRAPNYACQGEDSCPENSSLTPINEAHDKIVNYAAQINHTSCPSSRVAQGY
jgi:hypothetical protein